VCTVTGKCQTKQSPRFTDRGQLFSPNMKENTMKEKYKAMVQIMGGSSWGTSSTKGGAMKELRKQLKRDWSHLFNINAWLKSGNATCDIYQDSGTTDHGDDKYIETVPLI